MIHLKTVLLFLAIPVLLVAQETRLLRNPAICDNHIAFVYANDIWICGPNGGDARRLTSFAGAETNPHFSPDGQLIAFSGQYDGNTDVYVVSVNGGEPRRLTWHPRPDVVRGWTINGEKVVFSSGRTAAPRNYITTFWTISVTQTWPEQLPITRLTEGKFSPDGARFVYQKIAPWESEWRNYRGGQNNPIRIINLKTLEVEKLPWVDTNDNDPVWEGNKIFFLSDRDYVMNVWSYDLDTKLLNQVSFFKEFDCKNLESGDGSLIFENGGYLYTMEAGGGQPNKLTITAKGDFPWARPHWENVGSQIADRTLSPSGKRALFEARGEIFSVPAEKGDLRNISNNSAASDRGPAWSPDGKSVSWFSDESGEYQLIITDQYGRNKRKISIANPTFFYTPRWSPDSKYICFGDTDRDLWVMEVKTQKLSLIDNEGFAHPERTIYPEWSPDSKWIAYTKRLTNQYNAIYVYSVAGKKAYQLTDGLSDSRAPAWDASGKYLYFLASTNFALNVGWLDLSSLERPIKRAIYMIVLSADEPSPFLPESDEEGAEKNDAEAGEDEDDKEKDVKVTIDFKNINQRIIALDIPARDYPTLIAGERGVIFYSEVIPNADGLALHHYNLEDREAKKILDGISDYTLSHDGKKLLYAIKNKEWFIVDTGEELTAGDGKLKISDMKIKVDPTAEWKQMFHEAWRYQRDYFYVENIHGLDLDWVHKTYAPWVDHIRHRADLTYVLDILGGETAVGHSFTGGGDMPEVERVPIGLLGANYKIENGYYRIDKIFTGENWNPKLRAPLSGPGIDVKTGDYLIAVNGQSVTSAVNLFSLFDQTAGKQSILTLNDRPGISGSRDVTVVPVADETALRARDWIENNRRKVDQLSDGKLAYVWVPNTTTAGYTSFNRYFFAQQNKKGAIIDERFNHGGLIADYIIDLLSRDLMGYFNNPVGNRQPFTAPNAAIWGPKVMIINETAGSGGDMLPYMFRLKKIGPLVGTRTWGGLVGIWDVPPLIDGGYITAPRGGFYNLDGEWDVENEGVPPDYEVEQEPIELNAGKDPQLEKAVEIALELLKTKEIKLLVQPADPVRVKRPE